MNIDYYHKIDTSASNPVDQNDGLGVIYLTGAGYVDYPFRCVDRDSALGWEEPVWGGDLTRSVNFVLTNVETVNYGLVARLEVSYKYMNIEDYKVLIQISKQRVCYATYYDKTACKWVERQEMAFTKNELGKLYAFGTEYIGNTDVSIKLVATNLDKVETTHTVTIVSKSGSSDSKVRWSDSFKIPKTTGVTYLSTMQDGSGYRYLPGQKITIFDSITLYEQTGEL